MPEYLQTTIDKFTFTVATDRSYAPDGIWLEDLGDGRVRVGVTDFLQQHSGDLAFASVKAAGTTVAAGDEFAALETVKVNLSLPLPIAGAIVEVNPALDANPEVVNQNPYEDGWLAVIQAAEMGAGSRQPARSIGLPFRDAVAGRAGSQSTMNDHQERIVVVPCSGIGKTFGSVSREAAYEVCDELRPDATRLLALSKLVLGEDEARERVRTGRTITIDGCKLMCAAKLVGQSGGTILARSRCSTSIASTRI